MVLVIMSFLIKEVTVLPGPTWKPYSLERRVSMLVMLKSYIKATEIVNKAVRLIRLERTVLHDNAFFPLSVRVVARIENQTWHEDLTSPETERYTLITNDIKSNVTSFYSNYPGLQVSVVVDQYRRNGSVIAEFTIMYNASNFSLIEQLNQSMTSIGHLHNMPLELKQLTPENGKPDLRLRAVPHFSQE
ncbi:hypothetical protein OS493_022570 [Desmophyllum pertusum]|uniref:Uncharacterized protein n=1 Tax=Desmophyllum pertusum TaxID=174260 RepID=A0A9X0CWX8_9CNID|nr:hypothetical protein OS493_022570 [Desmophyllum pertusum]